MPIHFHDRDLKWLFNSIFEVLDQTKCEINQNFITENKKSDIFPLRILSLNLAIIVFCFFVYIFMSFFYEGREEINYDSLKI